MTHPRPAQGVLPSIRSGLSAHLADDPAAPYLRFHRSRVSASGPCAFMIGTTFGKLSEPPQNHRIATLPQTAFTSSSPSTTTR